MAKFKKGDKVRFIADSSYASDSFTIGKVYEVREFPSAYNGVGVTLDDKGSTTNGHNTDCWELVTEESKVEALVRKANEGLEAVKTILTDHRNEVEYDGFTYKGMYALPNHPSGAGFCNAARFKVKQKPKFEPFSVGNHAVSLEGDTLRVGCQKFNPTDLKACLLGVLKNSQSEALCGDIKLNATREGVKHFAGSVSWENAVKILSALEKAGF